MQPVSQLRTMIANDSESVGALLNDIFRTRNGVFDQDVFSDFPLVFTESNYRNCRVITVDEEIVSHAAIFPCTLVIQEQHFKTAVIVLVATHAQHRERGHAARLMRDLQRTMAEENYDLGVLWTGVPRFYEKLGWETINTRGLMIVDLLAKSLPAIESVQIGAQVICYDEQRHLDGIIELHDREPVRVIRSRDEYRELLRLPKLQTWVLCRNQQIAAYVTVGQAHNKNGVLEYGGDVVEIAQLTMHVVRSNKFARPLQMLFFSPYLQLAEHFGRAGAELEPLESSKGAGCEMIYVVGDQPLDDTIRDNLFIWGPDST